jgi:RNA polymerase sigma-70 factor (ECF subfamily)
MDTRSEHASSEDLDLLRRARDGQWEAFDVLLSRYQPRVFGLTWRILQQREDAEDATQQTFIAVMENLDRFREEASVATWILRIATNQALTVLRKRRGSNTISLWSDTNPDAEKASLPHPEFISQWQDDPADLAQRAETRELLGEALAELDEKYRVVFLLRDVEGFSTQEAAEMLGISISNAKIRLLRARLQLRERLTRTLGDAATQLVPSHDHA